MANNSEVNPNAEAAQRIQETFDAYFLALIFTLLGASIQTAKFGASPVADVLELLGWLSFLVAGLSGLAYLEIMPTLFRLHGLTSDEERKTKNLEIAMLEGRVHEVRMPGDKPTVPVKQYIEESRRMLEEASKGTIEPMQRKGKFRFRLMKTFFVVGLVAVIVARGWVPGTAIFRSAPPSSQSAKPATLIEPRGVPSGQPRGPAKR